MSILLQINLKIQNPETSTIVKAPAMSSLADISLFVVWTKYICAQSSLLRAFLTFSYCFKYAVLCATMLCFSNRICFSFLGLLLQFFFSVFLQFTLFYLQLILRFQKTPKFIRSVIFSLRHNAQKTFCAEIIWNANLMQQGNFINAFLARHVSGTYAHRQEH